ncbi:MAG TPA: formate C-acetyltransferase/glycerol dehydratase family glycyl radical enzyme [Clostridiaceae bacterium]|mgnify:CR=1 FL=1|nr:formate C-acetyltransferase/glycerol dehydratase family glycyl radical enzyme [Clostridiaceae bacterium]HBF77232.1 formate C-acetyltransferase/glycerol dehydratase family glycyl radical enzyme [Clostridiaceae bacterium]HBG39766.1 formate C-acetyltransferase/glycerol dehydratase family glycyl radical enzyme [Clostridiaceae bacterium]HBN27536.1 formate C-acetyltransferase/glycerol dehydratase family glycyl radical enzyme [Clostridiaceae bacterium]HBX48371.1 formate C-acetyltransferase/glycerol
MNDRVKRLREKSIEAVPELSMERAKLVTEAYKKYEGTVSIPVLRALTFKYIMENKAICINDDELIVGERGPAPKATPTFPELCCHTMEDFQVINDREKTSFKVTPEAKETQRDEIIPYWKDRAIRTKIFKEMTKEWKDSYEAGIFTEFMEQRAPGHTVADGKIYKKGFADFKEDINEALTKLDFMNDPKAYDKQEELKAMSICCDGIMILAKRYAEKANELALEEKNIERKSELKKIAEVCLHVPAHAPRNFWEAIQAYWFVHVSVISELNTWDSFNPGRLDQHLYPFYKKDIEDGTLTEDKAYELLECFWIKFNNQPAPPKVGITLAESATYTDFANINLGGLKVDGSDGVNDVTYMILNVIDDMTLLQPSTNIQLSKKNPDKFLKRALKIVRKGWGQPSIFNADSVIEEMIREGKSIEDARCGGTSGCVETGCFGKEAYILTGYMNLVKILEITMHNGLDIRTGKKIGIETGDPRNFKSFEELMDAFKKQLHYFIDIKIKGNNVIEKLYASLIPCPFLSITVSDCIANGQDYNAGGARYNTRYIQGVGIGTITDSLSSIKYHVFDNKELTMDMMIKIIDSNYDGYENYRQKFLNNTPKYGNDNDYADNIMKEVFNMYYNEVNGRPTAAGGTYRIDMLPTTCHVYFGSVVGATPDGRLAYKPLSEGISPVQGADKLGPTAVLKSAAKMDHLRTGGTLLNQKFTPKLLEGDEGIDNLAHLIRGYFKLDGHHIQFNVVSAATLRAAQNSPEKYKNLIVRVAGYSDYFCDLNRDLQDEIISRTENTNF